MSVTYAAENITHYFRIIGGYDDGQIMDAIRKLADGGSIMVTRIQAPIRNEIVTRNDDGTYEVANAGLRVVSPDETG